MALSAPATADEENSPLWMTSGEVGVGPVGEDLFLQLTPRLTVLQALPMLLCDGGADCETLGEASLQVPLRLHITNREDEGVVRRQDWLEVSDFFRLIRRIEYGTARSPVHLRAGEIGPVNFGHGTIVNGYYNVVTTDHYRLGVAGHVDGERWGGELLVNDLTGPNLFGLRGRYRPADPSDVDNRWQRFTLGASAVLDVNAPRELAAADDDRLVAGPGLHPVVEQTGPTGVVGVDAEWRAIDGGSFALTPYADLNHHLAVGTGWHTGIIWDHDIADALRLSSRLEYRLMAANYLPDYFDPVYEITRYRHPALSGEDDAATAPKLTAATQVDPSLRHGGFAQLQTRIHDVLTLSAALSNGTDFTGSNLRLRASYDHGDRGQIGMFFYQFTHGEQSAGSTLSELLALHGALTAVEGRYAIWGPLYAQGQLARQWRLHDDGRFDSVHLWNVGLGAGLQF